MKASQRSCVKVVLSLFFINFSVEKVLSQATWLKECHQELVGQSNDMIGTSQKVVFGEDKIHTNCNLLVHGAVNVMVVMSSMKALIGGRHGPPCNLSPPTTHFEALIMTSIATVKVSGDCTSRYDSYLELSPPCGVVKQSLINAFKNMGYNAACILM